MLRGEFVRGDGLVIPNNITTYGVRMLFQWALVNSGYALHIGLANCNPDPNLTIEALNEPTRGLNGYNRQEVTRDAGGWPVQGLFNNEQYYETAVFTFEASGGNYDKPINRLALINSDIADTGQLVFALSVPLPEEITITPTTDLESRSFKYRIYGR